MNTNGNIAKAVGGDSLADVLERVLDKGIVIAGDISVCATCWLAQNR